MNKEKYERTQLEIIGFEMEDVITTSADDEYEAWNPNSPGGSGDEYESWRP